MLTGEGSGGCDTNRILADTLVYALADTLAAEEAETIIDTLVNVKAKGLVVALAKTLRDVKAEALIDTLFKVTAKALVRGGGRDTKHHTARS